MSIHERDLHAAAKEVGRRSARRIDIDRLAEDVVVRLREERESRVTRAWRRLGKLRAVAAVALLVTGGALMIPTGDVGDVDNLDGAVPGLEQLSAAELTEVLDSMALDVSVTELGEPLLVDLDEEELRVLLEELEG